MDVSINGIPLESFGGAALLDYSIGPTPLTTDVFQGLDRTNWSLLKSRYGLRTMEITIIFTGLTLREAKIQRSKFNAQLMKKAELFIADDGFFYEIYCSDFGKEQLVGIGDTLAKIKSKYKLVGLRHDPLETVVVGLDWSLFCKSTVPKTSCRISQTVTQDASKYFFGFAILQNIVIGDVLVFDGFTGTFTKNGASVLGSATWDTLPYLDAGPTLVKWGAMSGSTITGASGSMTVEYYPTYL